MTLPAVSSPVTAVDAAARGRILLRSLTMRGACCSALTPLANVPAMAALAASEVTKLVSIVVMWTSTG